MPQLCLPSGSWSLRTLGLIASAVVFVAPLRGQTVPRLDTGIVVTSDWLQANALPLDRQAMHSVSVMASYRRPSWSVDAGWLRVARDLSTVQGGAVLLGRPLYLGPLLFTPAVGVLGGQAQASADSTGFDWVGTGGTIGHTPRYSHSTAATFGGGAGLTIAYPLYRGLGIRAVVQEWMFSGAPLEGDRARTLLGAGLSLRVR